MDILDHLTQEHRDTEARIAALKETEEGDERNRLFAELKESLHIHMHVEERYVYPITTEVLGFEESSEATDEHQLAREGLDNAEARLEGGSFNAAMDVLEAAISHHVEEEESDLFPKMRALASSELSKLDPEALEATVQEDRSTQAELYEQAREQGIAGRSSMSRSELSDAVED